MFNPVVRLELYNKIGGDEATGYIYNDDPSFITTFNSLTCNFGIEKRKDSIRFNIPNQNFITNNINSFNDQDIDVLDLIKLYAYNTPLTGDIDDHLIMIAYVKGYTYDSTEGKALLNFTCYNRSEVLLNSFIFEPYNQGEKVSKMIVESINRIKSVNTNNQVEAYLDYTGTSTPGTKAAYDGTSTEPVPGKIGYIRAYKAAAYNDDGTIKWSTIPDEYDDNGDHLYYFKTSTFSETYKPFIEHLETLSQPKYTGDKTVGTYISFVDNDNNLYWIPKKFNNINSKTGNSNILREYESPSLNIDKNSEDIINAVIVNCGTDPKELGIMTLAYNTTSMGKYGAKWKYVAKTDLADSIRQKEIESGTRTADGSTSTGPNSPKSIGDDNYPSAYPWTIQTTAEDEFGEWTYVGGTTEVSSNQEYYDYFRRASTFLGKKVGENITSYSDEPKLKINYELEQGSNNYVAGDMTQLVIPSRNILENDINPTLVRLISVTHTFQGARWTTSLELEEDVDYRTLI